MKTHQNSTVGKRNFIFYIDNDNKRRFKALAARSGLTMSDILNDLVKNVLSLDIYEIKN